jgi:serine/threonine protein kinase/tetratricopeptide (TPR) repeat protein
MAKGSNVQAPNRIGPYEIVRRLGSGGMAEVFLANKPGAEGTYKQLVVKRILPSHGGSRRFRAMFVEEAQLATRLNHPNVVQVFDFHDGGDEGLYLAMELVEGPDLGMLMSSAKARSTRLPCWVGAWIIAEAAKGLHYAHEKKDETGRPLEIVHRDVSPQNILLSYEGAVKIADFGIATARLFSEEEGVIKGKFGYMSPEQARGEKVDRRSDIYALGVILWEVLTGRPLHGGLGGEALLDIVRSGYVENPSTYVRDLPQELEEIVMKALAPSRDDRFATARELSAAIARALLVRQELVDASTLELVIASLIVRETSRPKEEERPAEHRTSAAAPMAKSVGVVSQVAHDDGGPIPAEAPPSPRSIGPREVRHVAVVTLRLFGLDELAAHDPALAQRTLERIRTMLGDLAFKRNMRLWIWSSDTEARAVAGLTGNPGRAAADAANLALDAHEVIAGAAEDLPVGVRAALGIVRGIASGTRDPQGNLVRYVLHDPVSHLADVLAAATPQGRTWVAGGVYRLVRREFRWGDAPTLDVPYKPGVESSPPNMRIYALQRRLSREERQSSASGASSDLVGRDAEKADLHAAYHEAVAAGGGAGNVVARAVVGEMGIGKSALVTAFESELPPNARVVRAECTPVRMEIPWSLVGELVRSMIGATGEEPFAEVAQLIARAGGGAAEGDASNPMVARLAELATNQQVGGGDDEDANYRRKLITSGVRSLLAALALSQPVVVVVEGLQWADRLSAELVADLLSLGDPLPILFVLVARPEDHVQPLLEGVMRVELHGLSAEEQVRLVEARLGVSEGVAAICAELLPRVGGNPFFLLEMVDALLERGALEIREDSDEETGEKRLALVRTERGDQRLPSTLEQLLADRIRELPEEEHAVVDWLAVAGGPLAVADLGKLLGSEDEDAIVRLLARGIVDRKGDALDFRHPLTRDVAYAALSQEERVRRHRALGAIFAEGPLARGLSAAIVARHMARGDDGERAAEFYVEAGNAARASYQTQLAIRYYKRALALLPHGSGRLFAVHDALEGMYRMLGRRRERVQHLEGLRRAARAARTPRAACIALLRTARYELDEGRLVQGLPVARQAAEIAHAHHLVQQEVETEALVSELLREMGDVQGALAACDRALAASNPAVNPGVPPRLRAEVLRLRGVLLRRVGRVKEAVDTYVESIAILRKVGARRQEARTKNSLAFAMFVQGRYEDCIALGIESIQINLSIGGRFQIANTLTNIGNAYAKLGDMPRAQAYLKRARETHDRYGDQDNRADTLIVSAEAMMDEDRLEEARHFLVDARALSEAQGNAYASTHEKIVTASLLRRLREPKRAAELALEGRRAAEAAALVSFHFYGVAVEAAARVDMGEMHTGTLLATTALGAVETIQGCEYGLEIRVLCADALKRAASPQAAVAHQRAVDYAQQLSNGIRDARLRRLFGQRPLVAALFDSTPAPNVSAGARSLAPEQSRDLLDPIVDPRSVRAASPSKEPAPR